MSIVIHNPTDSDVLDYPIQDPKTQEVALWSIKSGETLKFPDYVGQYLLDTYQFLQREITRADLDREKQERERLEKNKHFSQVRLVDDAPNEEAKKTRVIPPPKVRGFTKEALNTQPEPYQKAPDQVVEAQAPQGAVPTEGVVESAQNDTPVTQ